MNNNVTINKSKLKNRPVLNLKETEKNYLKFLKAYGNEFKKEIESSEIKLKDFLTNFGELLQQRLLERNKILSGSINDLMEQDYLKQRNPLSIERNYYILFDYGFKNHIDAVAKLILCSNMLKKLIKENRLEHFSNKCPIQYFLLFNSCLSPFLEKDKLLTFDHTENNNIIVIYNNNFWVLEETTDYDEICEQLIYITTYDVRVTDENFIGMLTTGERNKYAIVKDKFLNLSKKNKDFMQYIQESMLVLSLENISSTDMNLIDINNLCWYSNGCNRFYDKLFQFVILKDGLVSMNVKKGFIDISVCIEFSKLIYEWTSKNEVFMNNILKDKKKKENSINDNFKKNYFENFSNKPHMLGYDINSEIKDSIKEFSQGFIKIKEKIKTEFLFFNDYGKEVLQQKGLNPISFIQTAVLAAYYRVYGEIVASREFTCGRNFAHGVSEWIRTTTQEAINFSIALSEIKVPRDLKVKLGFDAFKAYKQNTLDINHGKSIDLHLLSLASVTKSDEKIPFFEDFMYKKSSNWIIDFYPVTSNLIKLCAYAPPNSEGIGLTYLIRKDQIQFVGTSYNSLGKFFEALIEVMKEMRDLFIEKERDFLRPKF